VDIELLDAVFKTAVAVTVTLLSVFVAGVLTVLVSDRQH
jgi:hypothetical protein